MNKGLKDVLNKRFKELENVFQISTCLLCRKKKKKAKSIPGKQMGSIYLLKKMNL